jgi:hypothetical protein
MPDGGAVGPLLIRTSGATREHARMSRIDIPYGGQQRIPS